MQSSALLLPTANDDTHDVHVLSVQAVQMHVMDAPHSAHVAPEKAGQLAHASFPHRIRCIRFQTDMSYPSSPLHCAWRL